MSGINENFWTKIDGNTATVGITNQAQSILGEITYVQLPEIGKSVKKEEEVGVVESLKAISPLISPIDGEICEVNAVLEKKPELINESPLDLGWIWKMKIA
ncbi:MAG: glycine cleavage system protein H [Chitinivibrionia bacterium]|nr:glycine cleavage system protein H [Chitinivibrionia bacterium]